MGKHRSRLKILAKILHVVSANNGAKKTQIMYQAYLSYKLLLQYLRDLNGAGLLKNVDDNRYVITQRGEEFLEKFRNYNNIYQKVEKQLSHVKLQKKSLEAMCPNMDLEHISSK